MEISGYDFDGTFLKVCDVLNKCRTYSPRGQLTKEIIGCKYIVEEPYFCILTNPHRKLSIKYLQKELEWYMKGDLNIEGIKDYASMWEKIAGPNGEINSNYGFYVWKQKFQGKNQFEWVCDALKKDQDSRQAVINFNQPCHKYEDNKDFVCTLSTQYFIRNGKLDCQVNMRSQDFVFGAGNDLPFFVFIQHEVLLRMKETYPDLQMGTLATHCGSLHIYERHFEMLNKIVNDETVYYKSKNLFEVIGG